MKPFMSLIAAAAVLLSACQTDVRGRAPNVTVRTDDYTVDVKNGGTFCPPGQAKKGNC